MNSAAAHSKLMQRGLAAMGIRDSTVPALGKLV
jgi:hypothetical protein